MKQGCGTRSKVGERKRNMKSSPSPKLKPDTSLNWGELGPWMCGVQTLCAARASLKRINAASVSADVTRGLGNELHVIARWKPEKGASCFRTNCPNCPQREGGRSETAGRLSDDWPRVSASVTAPLFPRAERRKDDRSAHFSTWQKPIVTVSTWSPDGNVHLEPRVSGKSEFVKFIVFLWKAMHIHVRQQRGRGGCRLEHWTFVTWVLTVCEVPPRPCFFLPSGVLTWAQPFNQRLSPLHIFPASQLSLAS